MSPDTDRIAVPTNGRKPHPGPSPDAAEPERLPLLRGEPPAAESAPGTSDEELSVAFTPKQVAIGFGILASLLLLIAGAARRRSGR